MTDFERLMDKAEQKGCRLQVRFDPQHPDEKWGIKFYPNYEDNAYFYSYHDDLQEASRALLSEMQERGKW